MITFEFEGKTYEFTGKYRPPVGGDYFLSDVGAVCHLTTPQFVSWPDIRAIVHPRLATITHGGIMWEVVAHRQVHRGEWACDGVNPKSVFQWGEGKDSIFAYDILIPVGVCGEGRRDG